MATQDLCTLAYVKTFLESTAANRDALIQQNITAASDAIMKEVEREFKTTVTNPATRAFRWDSGTSLGRILDLSPFDCQAITSVYLSPEGANELLDPTIPDYWGVPVGASATSAVTAGAVQGNQEGVFTGIRVSDLIMVRVSNLLFRMGFMQVQVTGTWGWASVPTQVQQACAVTAAEWTRKDVAAFAIEDYGRNDALMAEPQGYYSLPPAALKMLAPFRRFAGVY